MAGTIKENKKTADKATGGKAIFLSLWCLTHYKIGFLIWHIHKKGTQFRARYTYPK